MKASAERVRWWSKGTWTCERASELGQSEVQPSHVAILTHLSPRKAFSNILHRRPRSLSAPSFPRFSPSSRAIRALISARSISHSLRSRA